LGNNLVKGSTIINGGDSGKRIGYHEDVKTG
jgi:hypothetical protein